MRCIKEVRFVRMAFMKVKKIPVRTPLTDLTEEECQMLQALINSI